MWHEIMAYLALQATDVDGLNQKYGGCHVIAISSSCITILDLYASGHTSLYPSYFYFKYIFYYFKIYFLLHYIPLIIYFFIILIFLIL